MSDPVEGAAAASAANAAAKGAAAVKGAAAAKGLSIGSVAPILAPLAALAVGQSALRTRKDLEEDIALTERELEDIKKKLGNADASFKVSHLRR
jgi:hypothetical protein